MLIVNNRTADHPIDPVLLERWSPRAYTGEAIEPAEFMTILEAARWAPSASNAQPWRFLYAHRETIHWERFLSILNESNRVWAVRAATLLFIVSKGFGRQPGATEDRPSYTHSFDAGAAWAQLALQATRSGWHAHAMAGFDKEAAVAQLRIPPGYRVEAAVAIGRWGDVELLPEALRQREKPSPREPLSSTLFEGPFPLESDA